jgi:hypothetical protein
MSRTYVTDITHYLDGTGEIAEMPGPARKLASFLTLLIDAATQVVPIRGYDTRIRCSSKACHGSIRTSLASLDQEIVWSCPECGHNGTIRNWQGTKWNQQRTSSTSAQPRTIPANPDKAPAASDYTPRQGQFLAFIYYYTRVHRTAPAELDMQQYFGVSAPAVHQMVVTLEKRGFIERRPGEPRSIRLLLPRARLPDLD